MAHQVSQRKRAITIYLATEEEKKLFAMQCKNLGLTVSFVAGLAFYRGLEAHIVEELANVMPNRTPVQKATKVVKSKRTRQPAPAGTKPKKA